ncbi:MAG: hypothetical protein H6730_13240 [Deltaproteobacteria bacterium]|nr:hypothetical protein [Deltaproteobacteria bacterium]
MVQLPPPSVDMQALLPMPGQRVSRDTSAASAQRLVGSERALLSDAPSTGVSMLSLRAGSAPKKGRR